MAKRRVKVRLLGITEPDANGNREWRFAVDHAGARSYYTIDAPNHQDAARLLEVRITNSAHTHSNLPARVGDDKVASGGELIAIGVGGAIVFAVYSLIKWWRRDDDGPTSGFGFGFGKGTGSWINLNPFDKGKWAAGDDDEEDEDLGPQWERVTIEGVRGWRRKGVPLPKEKGGPATYQAAVLIVGNNTDVPDVSGWPKTVPVFFVHDAKQQLKPLLYVEGGWGTDARFGSEETEFQVTAKDKWFFNCAAVTSKGLTACIKEELANSVNTQWV